MFTVHFSTSLLKIVITSFSNVFAEHLHRFWETRGTVTRISSFPHSACTLHLPCWRRHLQIILLHKMNFWTYLVGLEISKSSRKRTETSLKNMRWFWHSSRICKYSNVISKQMTTLFWIMWSIFIGKRKFAVIRKRCLVEERIFRSVGNR